MSLLHTGTVTQRSWEPCGTEGHDLDEWRLKVNQSLYLVITRPQTRSVIAIQSQLKILQSARSKKHC